jgi:hypothetical protein
MSWKEWTAVAVVIGGGLVFQISRQDDMEPGKGTMERGEAPAEAAAVVGAIRTVALDVTGMT